jgi:hypothetical protein
VPCSQSSKNKQFCDTKKWYLLLNAKPELQWNKLIEMKSYILSVLNFNLKFCKRLVFSASEHFE